MVSVLITSHYGYQILGLYLYTSKKAVSYKFCQCYEELLVYNIILKLLIFVPAVTYLMYALYGSLVNNIFLNN